MTNLADMCSITDIQEEPSEEQTMKNILQSIRAGDAASVSAQGSHSRVCTYVGDVLELCSHFSHPPA